MAFRIAGRITATSFERHASRDSVSTILPRFVGQQLGAKSWGDLSAIENNGVSKGVPPFLANWNCGLNRGNSARDPESHRVNGA